MFKKKPNLQTYFLHTQNVIKQFTTENLGQAYIVDKNNFNALNGITCYTLEIWEECMRLPHWHPNASELGYVVSGEIEIIIWRSPGESAVFTLKAGMCWFIPQGALHSLNNVGHERAQLLVGFSADIPLDVDLPVAFNGIPVPIRSAYTAPHAALREWQGVQDNPLVGRFTRLPQLNQVLTASPYGFDFSKVSPLFENNHLGSVVWGIKNNWSILEKISILRAILKKNVARDPIWYPDVDTLYVVVKGTAEFHIIIAGQTPAPQRVNQGDYIFVPVGTLHTFINTEDEDFKIIAFFNKANPVPEVSLSVATAFFPKIVRQDAMTRYGLINKNEDPLHEMQYADKTPYLLKL